MEVTELMEATAAVDAVDAMEALDALPVIAMENNITYYSLSESIANYSHSRAQPTMHSTTAERSLSYKVIYLRSLLESFITGLLCCA